MANLRKSIRHSLEQIRNAFQVLHVYHANRVEGFPQGRLVQA
jgi:hypothetical protein